MKKSYSTLFIAFIGISVLISGCKPIGSCTETKEGKNKNIKYSSKRIRTLVSERDDLCNQAFQLSKSLTIRESIIKSMDSSYKVLQKSYEECTIFASNANEVMTQKNLDIKALKKQLEKKDSTTNAIHELIKKALLGFNSDELTTEIVDGKIYVSLTDKLLFKSGSDVVEDKGVDAIKKLAEVIKLNDHIDILIEGHTDNVPIKSAKFKDNWDLSTSRASNIVRLLIKDSGINPKLLTAAGKGEFSPVAPNDTPENKAKNRRTEIIISPRLTELIDYIQK